MLPINWSILKKDDWIITNYWKITIHEPDKFMFIAFSEVTTLYRGPNRPYCRHVRSTLNSVLRLPTILLYRFSNYQLSAAVLSRLPSLRSHMSCATMSLNHHPSTQAENFLFQRSLDCQHFNETCRGLNCQDHCKKVSSEWLSDRSFIKMMHGMAHTARFGLERLRANCGNFMKIIKTKIKRSSNSAPTMHMDTIYTGVPKSKSLANCR